VSILKHRHPLWILPMNNLGRSKYKQPYSSKKRGYSRNIIEKVSAKDNGVIEKVTPHIEDLYHSCNFIPILKSTNHIEGPTIVAETLQDPQKHIHNQTQKGFRDLHVLDPRRD